VYKNLKAEMLLQNVKVERVAELLGIRTDTARLKINGKVPFRISECHKVATLFDVNNDIGYLFSASPRADPK